MKITFGLLIALLALAGCSAVSGEAPEGPSAAQGGKAMSDAEFEASVANAPPEIQQKMRDARAKSAGNGYQPPKK